MVGVSSLAALLLGERVAVFLVLVVFLAGSFFVVLDAAFVFVAVLRGARVFFAAAVVVLRVLLVLGAGFSSVSTFSATSSKTITGLGRCGGRGGGGGGAACGAGCGSSGTFEALMKPQG